MQDAVSKADVQMALHLFDKRLQARTHNAKALVSVDGLPNNDGHGVRIVESAEALIKKRAGLLGRIEKV